MSKTVVVNKKHEPFDIYIGRGSKWGNPYIMLNHTDTERRRVIALYKHYILTNEELFNSLEELKGKRLGCYCKPKYCHGDVLVELLNEKEMAKAKKYEKIVIGIDESYQETGLAIMADDRKLLKYYGIKFPKCKSKCDKRNYMKKVLNSIIPNCLQKANEVVLLVERIRTFNARGQGGFSLSTDYIKATAALIATIVDTANEYDLQVQSVDTRSWKAQVLGSSTSKGQSNNNSKSKNKDTAIQHVLKNHDLDVSYKTKTGKLKYNDNIADAVCIAEYGFIPKSKQTLKLEQ